MHWLHRRTTVLFYWLFAMLFTAYWSYTEQKEIYDNSIITPGKVVAKISVFREGKEHLLPQLVYVADRRVMYFAENAPSLLKVGDRCRVIYQKSNPLNVQVYNPGFWINLRICFIGGLLAFVFFGLVWGLTQKFPSGTEVLPSNKIV